MLMTASVTQSSTILKRKKNNIKQKLGLLQEDFGQAMEQDVQTVIRIFRAQLVLYETEKSCHSSKQSLTLT